MARTNDAMDIAGLFDDDWFAHDLDVFINELENGGGDAPSSLDDERALDIELAPREPQRGHRNTDVARAVAACTAPPSPDDEVAAVQSVVNPMMDESADAPVGDAPVAARIARDAPPAAAAMNVASAVAFAPLLVSLLGATPQAAAALALATAGTLPPDTAVAGGNRVLGTRAARAYRKGRLVEKRRARKARGHTHYADRRSAAQSRVRVGGRFQKKHHGTWQTVDERKAVVATAPPPPTAPAPARAALAVPVPVAPRATAAEAVVIPPPPPPRPLTPAVAPLLHNVNSAHHVMAVPLISV